MTKRKPFGGVVLDIEGTTTPVSFVYDVLFPYARRHLREYLHAASGSSELVSVTHRLHSEWEEESDLDRPAGPWSVDVLATFVEWLMDRDIKSTGLKELQGNIWERGYRDGSLQGVVYPDVPPALERWCASGTDVAIYSSGSVRAQALLFAHSTAGDLTPFIDEYFDTRVGAKRAAESYERIAEAMGHAASVLLFISDVEAELDAAETAGFQTLLCVRPPTEARANRATITSFDQIDE